MVFRTVHRSAKNLVVGLTAVSVPGVLEGEDSLAVSAVELADFLWMLSTWALRAALVAVHALVLGSVL